MKFLDRIFAKFWWSTHPEEAAFMQGQLIEARLEYVRQVTRCLVESIEYMEPPSEERDHKVREIRERLWKIERRAYGLEVSK